jgi:microcystin-dependent protein
MPTTGDLIDLNTLVLTDTFNTWLNRTNQIVDSINPLQIYDLDVGAGTTAVETGAGLAKYTGEVAGNYNGVITIGLNPGPGIAYESLSGQSRTVVDFRYFDDYGRVLGGTGTSASSSRVASSDEFIVNDVSVGGEGVAKKVQARYMLPPEISMDILTISGNVVILGNLSTYGNSDFIAANDLRIEDKQIELAYQQAIPLGMTGVTSGTFPLTGGPTAYYFTDNTSVTSAFYGHVQSFTGNVAGPTGTLVIGSLFGNLYNQNAYGPEDFGPTGYISLSSTGSTRYLYESLGGITNAFLSNINLDEGGIVLKGSEGDKSLLWIWTDNDSGDYYDSWQTNSNIGVNGNTYGIISRVYRSYGYTGITQSEFIFTAESGKNADIYLAETSTQTVPLTFTGGSWKISKRSSDNHLVFSVGTTGISGISESFLITPGASGTTYSGVTVNNYAKNFNSDLLDGAHASTTAAAYTIPVADSTGRIDGDFLNADAVRRRYVQASHGLTFGMAVRVIPNTGGYTAAVATTAELGEAVGIVSAVHSSSEFTVTHQGKIDGISGGLMTLEGVGFTAGNVYFLGASASNRGKLIADPDYATATRIVSGQIRKPLLLALSATQGYVLDYVGTKVPTPTDQVYLYGLVPVGTIQSYAGSLSTLSDEWLLCDGDVYRAVDYPELYNTIGTTYDALITLAAGTVTTGTIVGGSRSIEVGQKFNVTVGAITTEITVSGANATTGAITFSATSVTVATAGNYRLVPTTNSSGERLFFVPDLRTRTPLGGSTGSASYTSVGLSAYNSGEFGGTESIQIGPGTLPPHLHNTTSIFATVSSGSQQLVTSVSSDGVASTGSPIDNHSPYLVTHYIIRAKANTGATILTGHNHDDRYHPLNYPVFTLTAASNNAISETVPSNSFNIIAATGVAGSGKSQRTILSVYADQSPLQSGGSNTEVTVRGDFYVYANGLTADGFTSAPRYGETFLVRPNISTVTIVGGTGSALTLTRPAPVLTFSNGLTSGPAIGTIVGLSLTANITGDSHATSKYYSDTSDKTIKFVGSTNDWDVRHDSTALATRPGSETSILKVKYDQSNLNGTRDSACETYLYGDFTVFGDGLTHSGAAGNRTGHSSVTFAVDPMTSTVTVEGSSNNLGKPAPILSFIDTANPGNSHIGKIKGLTAPVADDQAANKWYVDRKNLIFEFSGDNQTLDVPTQTSYLGTNSTVSGAFPSFDSSVNGYYFRMISTTDISEWYQKSINSFTPSLITDEPGIYLLTVNFGGDSSNTTYSTISCVITGLDSSDSQVSRSRPYHIVQANIPGKIFMTFQGIVKIVSGGKFTVNFYSNNYDEGNRARIGSIMLTRMA